VSTTFDWKAFEAALLAELTAALQRFAKEHGKETFYAVALYGVSRELDGLLALPLLAASSVEKGPPPDKPPTFWGARFNPADWPYQEIGLGSKPALKLEQQLTAEATRSTPAHWRATEKTYFQVLVRIAGALRDATGALERTADFVCFWHDEEGGEDLARKTIDKALWTKLFAREAAQKRERARVAKQPAAERAAFLVTRFGSFDGVDTETAQRELLAMGAEAVDALVAKVGDKRDGWTAAKVLGQIGITTPAAIKALRARASEHWFAKALGMLGDHAWLAEQKRDIAVSGLSARLKAITQGGPPRPLDYAPLEAYLAKNNDARAAFEKELAPGSSYVQIQKADVDEAVRGLASKYAVVRWHAAAVLGDRELGAAAGAKALPVLATLLDDRNTLVRRLAVLSLSYWKAAAKPYHDAIRALADDPDPVIRSVAARA
jgi:hypothetical protein